MANHIHSAESRRKNPQRVLLFFFFQQDLVRINASPIAITNRKGNRAEIRARLVLNAHL